MLAEAILVHGDIGYKFCWLLPSEDQNQGTPIGNESVPLPSYIFNRSWHIEDNVDLSWGESWESKYC